MAEPWRCPDCGVEHRCDGSGGVPAVPAEPDPGPQPITINVKVEGSQINELARVIQQAILRDRIRNPSNWPRGT